MLTLRLSQDRGHANYGWLDTYHSFCFANYYDPQQVNFSSLRVINEDRVALGKGFPTHGHNDMEIITYVITGTLQHQDSMGNGSLIQAGEVQRMTAGTGVTHSEYNASSTEGLHLLQIWIVPHTKGLSPGYEQISFSPQAKWGQLCLIGSPDGRNGSVTIHQDVWLYASILPATQTVSYSLANNRQAYLHVVRGQVMVNQQPLHAGDAAKITQDTEIRCQAHSDSEAEILLFDLA